ncbi:hypothetical protein MMC30_001006, partial [Trapelia coarctata]|nr:hypothetical protein [Trapelia coarctata]
GVLAASIEQSRQKWLMEGIFEKYWTKPSKKKNQYEVQNPAKESMVKLGPCSMIIEPHIFEIMLYTVKDTHYTFLPPIGQPQPLTTPHGGHQTNYSPGTSTSSTQPQAFPASELPVQAQTQERKPPLQPSLPPFGEGFAHFEPHGLPPVTPARFQGSPRTVPPHTPETSTHSNGANTCAPAAPSHDSSTNTDPVIQMLAARAATDHGLKSLMKIVAQGSASPDQLAIFQRHIDELKSIIEAQQGDLSMNPESQSNPTDATHGPPVPVSSAHAAVVVQPPPMATVKIEPLSQYYSQPPQYLKPKGPVPPRPDISAVVFDFAAGTGDRYLIPKYSMLEYLPGGSQVLVSFLHTRKGSAASSGKYKLNVDYYEPVTLRLSTNVPRTLESLARAVAPPEEVRKYMSDIMTRMTLSEEVYLATQLPRAQEDTAMGNNEMLSAMEQEIIKPIYSPPDSLLPLQSMKKT